MKRVFSILIIGLVAILAEVTANAGGHGYGGGGHGCGGYGGHGYYGHGYYGGYYGHGCYGWGGPYFSFGIGFGGPGYGFYAGYPASPYPAYSYAYAPVVYSQPAYVYSPAPRYYTTAVVATAPAPAVNRTATTPVYVYSKAAAVQVVTKTYTPAPVRTVAPYPAPVTRSSPTGTWVLDPAPYSYTPAATYIVAR